MSRSQRRAMIDREEPKLSLVRQCALLGISRSSLYYLPTEAGDEDLELMALIDQQYLKTPFYGSRRMTAWLRNHGHQVNRKRVRRLMQLIAWRPSTGVPTPASQTQGIRSIRTCSGAGDQPGQPGVGHRHHLHTHGSGFPLLGGHHGLAQPLRAGLAAVQHPGGRLLCCGSGRGLEQGSAHLHTDQGSQFTSETFTSMLLAQGVQVSMDGRGRCMDNVFVERLWRSIKYEEVYLKAYQNGTEARKGIGAYLAFYNQERPHQALGYRSPGQVFHAVSPQRCLLELPRALPSDEGLRDTPAVDSLILASPLS